MKTAREVREAARDFLHNAGDALGCLKDGDAGALLTAEERHAFGEAQRAIMKCQRIIDEAEHPRAS